MISLKAARNKLLISHGEGVLNDAELLPTLVNFDALEDDECLSEFRLHKRDLPLLAEVMECYQRSICSGLEPFCILLKRQLSLQIFRHGGSICKTCTSVMHDKQLHDRTIYQSHSEPPNFGLE